MGQQSNRKLLLLVCMTENLGAECVILQKGMKARGFSADFGNFSFLMRKTGTYWAFAGGLFLHLSLFICSFYLSKHIFQYKTLHLCVLSVITAWSTGW